MPVPASTQEVEVKLRLPSAAAGRRILRQQGFRVVRRRSFETNTVFDTPFHKFRKRGELLRLREVAGRTVLTYKGPAVPGKHKMRPELELGISDVEAFSLILKHLGLRPVFRYEKYRTAYSADEAGTVALDETPIGVFLELEGEADWIDHTAARLGFKESSYITDSYGRLYLEHCRRRRIQPTHMVFSGSGETVCSSPPKAGCNPPSSIAD